MTIKFKNLLFASLIAIPVSLVSCNNGEKKEECDHRWSDYTYLDETYHHHVCEKCGEDVKEEHTFSDPVVTVEPTCCTEGAQVCTCSVCSYGKTESIPATGVHKYDQTVVLPENANLKEEATCNHPAIYFKTCACGEFKEEEGAPTFESGKSLDHVITSLNVEGKLIKTIYHAFEQFNPDGLTFKAHCSQCGEDLVIPAKDIVFTYDNSGSSFAVGETKVIANYSGQTSNITGLTVIKAINEILGMEDQDVHCGDKVVFAPYAKIDKDANITVEVKDKDNNVVDPDAKNAFNVSGSPYTATATLASTASYDTVTETCDITVTHPSVEWVSDKFYDKLVCTVCGKTERSFRTQVDFNFDFDSTTTANVDFSKLSSDDSIKYVVKDENDNVVSQDQPITVNRSEVFPSLPSEVSVDEITKTYIAEEVETNIVHEITVSYNIANKLVKTFDDLKVVHAFGQTTKKDPDINGYYLLANDIDCGLTKDTPWVANWGTTANVNEFVGTLDGRYHTIRNFYTKGVGLFGQLSGTIKDILFDNAGLCELKGGISGYERAGTYAPLLARYTKGNAVIDNVDANFSYIFSPTADLTAGEIEQCSNALYVGVTSSTSTKVTECQIDATCTDFIFTGCPVKKLNINQYNASGKGVNNITYCQDYMYTTHNGYELLEKGNWTGTTGAAAGSTITGFEVILVG
ncbi:MAG: hypothetical protein MJ213_01465 [Bacilli bacterium]|nr:hypothetical protein [Bacilli bacterium]